MTNPHFDFQEVQEIMESTVSINPNNSRDVKYGNRSGCYNFTPAYYIEYFVWFQGAPHFVNEIHISEVLDDIRAYPSSVVIGVERGVCNLDIIYKGKEITDEEVKSIIHNAAEQLEFERKNMTFLL